MLLCFKPLICSGNREDIFETFMGSNDELEVAAKELKDKTPPPVSAMMEKQSTSDALQKRAARSKLTTQNVPPTTPGTVYRAVCVPWHTGANPGCSIAHFSLVPGGKSCKTSSSPLHQHNLVPHDNNYTLMHSAPIPSYNSHNCTCKETSSSCLVLHN